MCGGGSSLITRTSAEHLTPKLGPRGPSSEFAPSLALFLPTSFPCRPPPPHSEPCKSTALNWDFKEKPALFFKQVYKEILIQDNNTCQQCPVIVLPFVVLLGNNFPAGEAPAGTSCFSICDWICPPEGLALCDSSFASWDPPQPPRKTSPEGSLQRFTICPSPPPPPLCSKNAICLTSGEA